MGEDRSFQRALKAHQLGQHGKVRTICDSILNKQPHHFDALHLRGLVAVDEGDLDNAVALVNRSLMINPSQPSAHNNIGNIYRRLGDGERARNSYRQALQLQPKFADAWSNLATVCHDSGEVDEALNMVETALKIDPDHAIALHTRGFLLMEKLDLHGAAKAFEKSTKSKLPQDLTPVWYAKILINSNLLEEARRILVRWLDHYPDDEVARHYLDAVEGKKSKRVPERAVSGTFDNFAASFDRVLVKNLLYQGPQLVGEALAQLYAKKPAELQIADLGCGTGLMAPVLAPMARYLVGVDLSARMLQKAKNRGGYDELVEDDLIKFLDRQDEQCFDLVSCIDTLCYIGDLSETLTAVCRTLKRGQYFIATAEESSSDETPYQLELSGRFSHRANYVEEAINEAGLTLAELKNVQLRTELGKPVGGLLVVARR